MTRKRRRVRALRCVSRSGKHDFTYFIDQDEQHVTASCDHCGAVHRFSVAGSLLAQMPMDDLSADEIRRRTGG